MRCIALALAIAVLVACTGKDDDGNKRGDPSIIDLSGTLSNGTCGTCDDLTIDFAIDNPGLSSVTGVERIRIGVGFTGIEHDASPCAGEPWSVGAEETSAEISIRLEEDSGGVTVFVPCNDSEATSRHPDLADEFPGPGTLDLELWVIVGDQTQRIEASAEI
jgi:hypothetical protein